MAGVDFNKNPPTHVELRFCAERGYAIAQYAYYEEALACLFAYLIGLPPQLAGIPFFKINNARSRVAILERLLKKKHGATYNIFWNSLIKELQKLDNQRNNVVHWTTVITCSEPPVVDLIPPNYWDSDANTPAMNLQDLEEFSAKCNFFTATLSFFLYTLQGEPFVPPAWLGIFQLPVTYPPPTGHPLNQP